MRNLHMYHRLVRNAKKRSIANKEISKFVIAYHYCFCYDAIEKSISYKERFPHNN